MRHRVHRDSKCRIVTSTIRQGRNIKALVDKLDLNIFDYLQESSIYINEIPVSSSNIDNFSTFAIAKYNTYLNLYGTIFG